jgi:PAS domain S-box-containing protein
MLSLQMTFDRWKQSSRLVRAKAISTRVPLIIAGAYAGVSTLWIALSDQALTGIAGSYVRYQQFQTYKGWLFVVASTLFIYVLLARAWRRLLTAYQTTLESDRRLQLALTSAGGGTWELDLTGKDQELDYVSGELIRRLGLPEGHRLTIGELRRRRHPEDNEEADRKLAQAIASGGKQPYDIRYRVRCEDGLYRWVQVRGNVIMSPDGKPLRMVGVALDIDERVRAEQRVGQLLRYDPVTGLARQGKFLADLHTMLHGASADAWVGVVQVKLLDLDRLIGEAETVEDATLIRLVGDRLHDLPGVLFARIAADVFAFATAPSPSMVEAHRGVRAAMENLLEPIALPDGSIRLRVQAGGALGMQGLDSAIGLLRNSGHALDLASRTTDIDVRWFNHELGAEYAVRTDRIRGLDTAVPHNEIECHYQPLVDLKTGRTAGFEALARWRRKDGTLVPPDKFIALAEEVGKIAEIGEDVLKQACRAAAAWPEPRPFVAVNVSPLQLEDPTFPGTVAQVLRTTGLSPSRLELEITENALPRDQAVALQRILALRDLGVGVAIDDFGTGYSSLALLSRVPFTRLKIDRSFVSGNINSRENPIIINTIIDLAQNLGLPITAEGVETADQAHVLAAKGVELAQGYYFSGAVPTADVGELVARVWPIPAIPSGRPPGLRLVKSRPG